MNYVVYALGEDYIIHYHIFSQALPPQGLFISPITQKSPQISLQYLTLINT